MHPMDRVGEQYTASQMTYDLRRLRLKGLIFRPTMRFSPFHCDKLWIASTDNLTSSSMTPSRFQKQANT
jgi:hypothetical protein